ncbi:hypothetical protein [Paracnuella aquatica]|uniref:hypothetical protein n=1 Tax=Paracnuella aquatica TaxID=2268757 RepID=UPI000DEFD824|nr:hypothetical protein [Paracnuella aquatica]RPD43438.1 hypothetical protein DRJ53_20090 [Paracnuella aquatica]
MKTLYILFLSTIPFISFSQNRGYKVQLAPKVYLLGSVGEFNPYRHKIDTCLAAGQQYICKIDGQSFYGIDQGLELPQTELFSLTIQIDGKKIPLNVSGMFNSTFGGGLSAGKFSLQRKGNAYYLESFFSDGAGTYIAKWKVENGKAERVLISNDERHFSQ